MNNQKKRTRNLRQALFLAVVAVLAIGGFRWLQLRESGGLGSVTIRFEQPGGARVAEFTVEVVSTEAERSKGLMYRKKMDPDRGMLFLFGKETEHSFWMKNTLLPLDMVFIDHDWKVVGILENVPVLNTEPRSVHKPSQYVLELNAGTAKRTGITVGSTARVQGVLPQGT